MDKLYMWLYNEPYSKPSPPLDTTVSSQLREATHRNANEVDKFRGVLRKLSDHHDPLAELVRRITTEQ